MVSLALASNHVVPPICPIRGYTHTCLLGVGSRRQCQKVTYLNAGYSANEHARASLEANQSSSCAGGRRHFIWFLSVKNGEKRRAKEGQQERIYNGANCSGWCSRNLPSPRPA